MRKRIINVIFIVAIISFLLGFKLNQTIEILTYKEPVELIKQVFIILELEREVIVEIPAEVVEVEPEYIEMEVVASAYCIEPHHHICNDGNASVTATGTMPTAGRTIAVDPTIIPYGSQVEIDGHIYTAEDTGGAIKGNRIDIVFDTHQEALNFGIQNKTVKIYK